MINAKTCFAVAILLAAFGASQAQAGMSGTSARIQQHAVSEAQGAVQAPPPAANPVAQASQRQAPARQQQPQARPSGGTFDGVWSVRSSPGCGLDERSAVEVVGGRVIAPGVSGRVDANGNVRTVARGHGLTMISTGRVGPTSGSGTYTISNGCTGTWTSSKV